MTCLYSLREFYFLGAKGTILIKADNIEKNFFSVGRYWGNLNASLKRKESVWWMNTGVAVSDMNWAWNETPLAAPDTAIVSEIREDYKKNNLRFWWWVYPCGQSAATSAILQNAGFRLYANVCCMAADLNESFPEPYATGDMEIYHVRSREDLAVWEDVAFHGFEMPRHARDPFGAFVSSFETGDQSPQRFILGCIQGKPVATSLLFKDQRTAGIYYVSTLPSYRNRGCGLSVTQTAMQLARESGFKDVVLQATPMGKRVYERLNFKRYYHAGIYTI